MTALRLFFWGSLATGALSCGLIVWMFSEGHSFLAVWQSVVMLQLIRVVMESGERIRERKRRA